MDMPPGAPAWNIVPENGNHNWIEVWSKESGWQFIEALPAGGSDTLSNPCDKWFCNPTQFNNGTEVFRARFERIPGEDRTKYYQEACLAC
jgi:hypothetical protein